MLIKKLILTAKAFELSKKGIYSFYVNPSSNKYQIKLAIEKNFENENEKIEVKKVRTIRLRPVAQKERFTRKKPGKLFTKLKKKALVELMPGQTLPLFSFTEEENSKQDAN